MPNRHLRHRLEEFSRRVSLEEIIELIRSPGDEDLDRAATALYLIQFVLEWNPSAAPRLERPVRECISERPVPRFRRSMSRHLSESWP